MGFGEVPSYSKWSLASTCLLFRPALKSVARSGCLEQKSSNSFRNERDWDCPGFGNTAIANTGMSLAVETCTTELLV